MTKANPTKAHATEAHPTPQQLNTSQQRANWRQNWVSANIWLLFLLFPIFTIAVDDISTWRKAVAIGLIVCFAAMHMLAFRQQLRSIYLYGTTFSSTRAAQWFAALVATLAITFAFGSWPVLAILPFVVSFAVFNFSWRFVGLVFLVCLATTLIGPALGGVLGEIWFFSVIVAGVGVATASLRLEEEQRGERHEFQTDLAVIDERNRVARDVHDVLGHSLTVVILKVQVCERLLQQLDRPDATDQDILAAARTQLAELDTVSRRALSEIRSTVGGLRSPELADELTAARAVLADAAVELTVIGDPSRIDQDMSSTLAWVVREAVTNIVRHAQATSCQIELGPTARDGGDVLVRITDNGIGLGSTAPGNGLAGLRDRIEAAGAELRMLSSNGTVIEVLKLPAEARQ